MRIDKKTIVTFVAGICAAAGVGVLSKLFFRLPELPELPDANRGEDDRRDDSMLRIPDELLHWEETASVSVSGPVSAFVALNDNTVALGTSNALFFINTKGETLQRIPVSHPVQRMCEGDENGVFALLEDMSLVSCDRSGKLEKRLQLEGTETTLITGITFSDGGIYVADAGQRKVFRYGLNDAGRSELSSPDGWVVPSPFFDLQQNPQGGIMVANPGRHRLEYYDREGKMSKVWGKAGFDISGFCGCCNPSYFDVFKDGRVVTSEKGIPRVKIYSENGELLSVVATPQQLRGTAPVQIDILNNQTLLLLDGGRQALRFFNKNRLK